MTFIKIFIVTVYLNKLISAKHIIKTQATKRCKI